MELYYPDYIDSLIERLENAGYSAYVVGGSLRDMMLCRTPNDFDIATSASPEQTLKIFSDKKTIPTGLKHGTVTVLCKENIPVEITTYRIDGKYSDSRHPENVTFTDDIKKDLSRRGRSDLEQRIIKAVGEPELRMKEDALRIMRALRFSAQLGFSIEENTQKALRAQSLGLKNISGERLGTELSKLICAPFPEEPIKLIQKLGISDIIFDGYAPSRRMIDTLKLLSDSIFERLACFLYECEFQKAEKILISLKYSNAIKNSVISTLNERNFPIPKNDTDIRR